MRRPLRTLVGALALAAVATAGHAQPPPTLIPLAAPPPETATPPARPADVADPHALVAAAYDVISGPAGGRDWMRFRSLFLPSARLTVSSVGAEGAVRVRTLSVEDFVVASGAAVAREGFFERGVRDRLDRWAHTATIRSLYESRHAPADAKPFARGINTFVMVDDGRRWWIASLSWEAEGPSAPIGPDALRP